MKHQKFEPIKIYYSAQMIPYFNEAKKTFTKENGITLVGISWEIVGNNLVITITQPQEEKWLFHLAFCIGKIFGKSLPK